MEASPRKHDDDRRPGGGERGADDAQPALAALPDAGPAIAELRPGQRFEGSYACVRKDRMTARNGSPYLALELRDRSGSISGRVFREPDRVAARFDRGDAVRVHAKAERFRGELQLEIDDVRTLADGEYSPEDFLPAAYRSVEELEGFLEHLAREVYDPALRGVVEKVLASEPVATEFRRAPCTRNGHHAYLGGLVEHTVAVGTLALELCQLHPRLDSDLLMAAILLHDVGKTREFTYGAEIGLSEEGRLLGHLAIGAEIIGPAAASLEPERRLALMNCVLSHHGPDGAGRGAAAPRGAGRGAAAPRGAGGSRSGFASAEAAALYRLNALDAQVKGVLEHGV